MGSSHWAYAVKMESGDLRGGINLRAPQAPATLTRQMRLGGGGEKSEYCTVLCVSGSQLQAGQPTQSGNGRDGDLFCSLFDNMIHEKFAGSR
jgi:hypothetical protein